MSYPPFSPGLQSFKMLFDQYPAYQRITFFAQDARVLDDHRPHRPETLRVAIMERLGKNRILTRKESGVIVRPNGMIPACVFGKQRRDYVVKWEDRLCFFFDGLFGIDNDPGTAWKPYHGPYSKQADRMDWFKKTLLWTPKREDALRPGGKKEYDWEAYEEVKQRSGRTIE